MSSYSIECRRRPKKIILQYCGRKPTSAHESSSDMSHSNSFNSEHSSESKDHFDAAHGFTKMFCGRPMMDKYVDTYCLLCYEKEKERTPDVHPAQDGPWKTHTILDYHGNAMCPLLYFSTCVCGTTGDKAHLPQHCPIVMALGSQ